MTPEQASKLRKGARILVEMVVNGSAYAPFVSAYMPSLRNLNTFTVDPADIHSILPRPLEAGDRVRDDDQDQLVGTIIAVHAQEAWVVWDGFRSTGVYPLSDLQRVEDEE